MNEQIETLAKAAGYDMINKAAMRALGFDVEKFAELIVRECSKVIRHGGQRKGAFGNEDLRPSEIATMIEEHFGVE